MTKLKLNIAGTQLEYEGNEEFLETKVPSLLEAVRKSHNEDVKSNLLESHEELGRNLAALDRNFASMLGLNEDFARSVKAFCDKSETFLERVVALQSNPSGLVAAAKE